LAVVLTRAGFLRMGSIGAAALTAGAALPTAARAQLPAPAPREDDVAFLAFLGVAAVVTGEALERAGRLRGFGPGERSTLEELRAVRRRHLARLNAALGPQEAVVAEDFPVSLPAAAFRSRSRALSLLIDLSEMSLGIELSGTAFAQDSATRLLLARLMSSERDVLTVLRRLDGRHPTLYRLPKPLEMQVASDRLDALLEEDRG
jgi:hypothetical protein